MYNTIHIKKEVRGKHEYYSMYLMVNNEENIPEYEFMGCRKYKDQAIAAVHKYCPGFIIQELD